MKIFRSNYNYLHLYQKKNYGIIDIIISLHLVNQVMKNKFVLIILRISYSVH